MVNGIRTSMPHGLNKGRGSKLCVGSQVQICVQDTILPDVFSPKVRGVYYTQELYN